MTQDELTIEVQSLAFAMNDEFGEDIGTVVAISELLVLDHQEVINILRAVPQPV